MYIEMKENIGRHHQWTQEVVKYGLSLGFQATVEVFGKIVLIQLSDGTSQTDNILEKQFSLLPGVSKVITSLGF